MRQLEQRLIYLRELQERCAAILRSIEEQGKLTPELRAALQAAATKQDLEDLYLPYKPKRRTKGQIAREAGLEPLADALWADPTLDPYAAAQPYVRGRAHKVLDLRLALPQEPLAGQPSEAELRLARLLGWSHQGRAADDLLRRCVARAWRVKLSLAIERDLFARLREQAEAAPTALAAAFARLQAGRR